MTQTLEEIARRGVFDSRDLAERLNELEGERESLEQDVTDAEDEIADDDSDEDMATRQSNLVAAQEALGEFDDESGDELRILQKLRDEIGSEFDHGETIISESKWPEYVQELCEDIGDIPRDMPSYIVIDWDATGENLKVDYGEIEIGGETYFFRSC